MGSMAVFVADINNAAEYVAIIRKLVKRLGAKSLVFFLLVLFRGMAKTTRKSKKAKAIYVNTGVKNENHSFNTDSVSSILSLIVYVPGCLPPVNVPDITKFLITQRAIGKHEKTPYENVLLNFSMAGFSKINRVMQRDAIITIPIYRVSQQRPEIIAQEISQDMLFFFMYMSINTIESTDKKIKSISDQP